METMTHVVLGEKSRLSEGSLHPGLFHGDMGTITVPHEAKAFTGQDSRF